MKFVDLRGRKFGRWTALKRGPDFISNFRSGFVTWLCRCECGTERAVRACSLRNGASKSCGCLNLDLIGPRAAHGNRKHGYHGTLTYKSWRSMKERCYNKTNRSYERYGAIGIRVCKRWRASFSAFLADVGERPSAAHTLDRRDNSKGYEPGNCGWATKSEQATNRRSTIFLTHAGRTLPMEAWAKEVGINPSSIRRRLNAGWPLSRAVTEPSTKK